MEWKRKSEVSEMYCAVHNVDCPLHGHSDDPWVLALDPTKIPDSWICPQAVREIGGFSNDVDEYEERNEHLENPFHDEH